MIGDEVVQAAIITKLKSLAPFTSSFGSVDTGEIKEFDWQGDSFSYPAIRVDLEENTFYFDEQLRCNLQLVEFSIYVYSEQKSSKECSQIKTNIINGIVGDGFSNQALGIKFLPIRVADNIPVVREDIRTWRSQIKLRTKVGVL